MRHANRIVALMLGLALVAAGAPALGDLCVQEARCPTMANASEAHDCCPRSVTLSSAMACCPADQTQATSPVSAGGYSALAAPSTGTAVDDAPALQPALRASFEGALASAEQKHDIGLFTLHSVYLI